MNLEKLGDLLKEARRAQRLTQSQLQDLSGVSLSAIYKLESGRTDLALGSLLSVADALGIQLVAKSPLGTEVKLNG